MSEEYDYSTLKVTPALLHALFNKPIDREFIINLENDLLSFIGSTTDSYLLQPMNSYYRLLVHQIAEYHELGHILNNGSATGNEAVIVYKTVSEAKKKDPKKPLLQELRVEWFPTFVPPVQGQSKGHLQKRHAGVAPEDRTKFRGPKWGYQSYYYGPPVPGPGGYYDPYYNMYFPPVVPGFYYVQGEPAPVERVEHTLENDKEQAEKHDA